MKKLCLVALIAIFSLSLSNAQEVSFGATAGYHNTIVRASVAGTSASSGESGIFAGLFADISLSEKFHLQPEVHYAVIFANGDSGNQIIAPIMIKFYAADQFFVQAGPQLDVILDESPGVKALGFGLGIGAGYEFSDKFFATTRYSFGLNDRLEDGLTDLDSSGILSIVDISTKFNYFQVGIGYRFN